MAEADGFPAGTPSWVDLGTSDVEASKTFYTQLFGWQAQDMGPEAGGYIIFTLRDRQVAGGGPLMNEGQPPSWSTYVTVDDAEKTTEVAKSAGATAVVEPMDVFELGRMAVLIDPTGAAVSLWQPGQHKGAQIVNEAGSFSWSELYTRDTDGAKAFYGEIFGWTATEMPMGDGPPYTVWNLGDRMIGGMMAMSEEQFPPEVPPHWLTYFTVEDADASASSIRELGGSLIMEPFDVPTVGRIAICKGVTDEVFAIIANEPS
jgi:uncharacterized protein